MTREDLETMWSDPANWNPDGSYKCARDPRILVPKLGGGGWTLNMMHAGAPWVMASVIIGALAIVVGVGLSVARR
jgi:uncharacterized membrane protein